MCGLAILAVVPQTGVHRFQARELAGLRSRVRTEVRPTENVSTRLYKNGDISVVITCSQLKFGR